MILKWAEWDLRNLMKNYRLPWCWWGKLNIPMTDETKHNIWKWEDDHSVKKKLCQWYKATDKLTIDYDLSWYNATWYSVTHDIRIHRNRHYADGCPDPLTSCKGWWISLTVQSSQHREFIFSCWNTKESSASLKQRILIKARLFN